MNVSDGTSKMAERIEFAVSPEESGKRIDKCITLKLGEGYSRTLVKDLIESGNVTVDGINVKPRHSVMVGEHIIVSIPVVGEQFLEPENIPLTILHEDEHIVIVNKPSGMVVHPGAGNSKGTLVAALLYHLGSLPEAGDGQLRPGIVHRLDKDTTGVMVVAKTDKAMRCLSEQFQQREVKKTYLALVGGNLEMDNGIVDAPIARQKTDRKKMGVEFSAGRASKTVYHVLERFGKFTLLRIDLLTGRTHQIRVHMQYLGHPVVGDIVYGGKMGFSRQALHAETLGFTHPGTAEFVKFAAPLPEDMIEFIKRVKKGFSDAPLSSGDENGGRRGRRSKPEAPTDKPETI